MTEGKIFVKEMSMMKEMIAFKTIVGCTKTTDLRNLGIFSYKVSCKWENHARKLGEEELS
jgi:hypothetical protein